MTQSHDIPHFVSDLMTEDLITVHASDRVGRARDLMIGIRVNALPVVEQGEVIGIISSSDLVDDWPDPTPIADVMRSSPPRIEQDASLADAAQKMLTQQVHHLIVEGNGGTVGILSSFDLLEAFVAPPLRS